MELLKASIIITLKSSRYPKSDLYFLNRWFSFLPFLLFLFFFDLPNPWLRSLCSTFKWPRFFGMLNGLWRRFGIIPCSGWSCKGIPFNLTPLPILTKIWIMKAFLKLKKKGKFEFLMVFWRNTRIIILSTWSLVIFCSTCCFYFFLFLWFSLFFSLGRKPF